MKRRILSFLVMIAIFIGTLGGAVFAAGEADVQLRLQEVDREISLSDIELYATHPVFKDVKDTDWFYIYVDYAHYYGLFKGTSDNTFSPNATMTRAMFATVIYRIFDPEGVLAGMGQPIFDDVKSTDYYYDAVTFCFDFGLIEGVGNGKFAPNAPVTRQEAATMMGRIFDDFVEFESVPHAEYKDSSSIASWAVKYVDFMTYMGFMEGYPDSTFLPLKNMTRAECAKVLSLFDYWLYED